MDPAVVGLVSGIRLASSGNNEEEDLVYFSGPQIYLTKFIENCHLALNVEIKKKPVLERLWGWWPPAGLGKGMTV